MNSNYIFLLGALPIVIYVIAESFTSRRKSLWLALGLGVMELMFSLIMAGGLDYITLVLFGLLVVFVGLSIKSNNDLYFKISGPVMSSLIAIFMLIAWFGFEKALLLDMAEKYGMFTMVKETNPQLPISMLMEKLRELNLTLPWWLLLHAAATTWVAFKCNKWIWFLFRVPGFYLVMGVAALMV